MNMIAVVVALTQVLAVAESSAQVRLDTTYCWPTVVVRRAGWRSATQWTRAAVSS